MISLLNTLDANHCINIAQIQKECMKSKEESTQNIASVIPSIITQDIKNSDFQDILTDQQDHSAKKNLMINSNNTNINPIYVVIDDPTKFSLQSKRKQLHKIVSITPRCFLLFIVLSIILTGIVIGGCFGIIQLKSKYDNIANEQTKNNETIQHLKNLVLKINGKIQYLNVILSKYNETIKNSIKNEKFVKDPQNITEGTTCGCKKWCITHGSAYGVCGDGHTCMCSQKPLTEEYINSGCMCNTWCREHGHKNGGVCGDGYTCICSK